MADDILIQGKTYPWLVDEDGRAYVWVKGDKGDSLITNYDPATSTYEYVGKAAPGTATSASAWQIKRIENTSVGGIIMTSADGDLLYDNAWDNRASLTYS